MKISISNISKALFGFAFIAIIVVACKKEMNDYTFTPDRQFTPGDIKIVAGETNAVLTWAASLFGQGKPVSYTVEVAKDSLFASGPEFTLKTNTPSITITDSLLTVKQTYYARVKANAYNNTAESHYVHSTAFLIKGEQIFLPVQDLELTDSSVILRWRPTPNLTKIVITSTGNPVINITLTAADITAAQKKVTGLKQLTQYTAEIFQNNLTKGFVIFTTKEKSIFTVILNPGDDLVAAVNAAVNGDVIGLKPGLYETYNTTTMEWSSLPILEKTITIASTSNNPADTKVNYREITLKGTGAGVTLRGIEWDGTAAAGSSLYFLNFTGAASDGDPANFTFVSVDNCKVTNFGNCFIRANRAANNAHKIESIKVNNSIIGDCRILNAYTFLTLDKLEFGTLELTNSTIYTIGRAMVGYSTNITLPNPANIKVDRCTINNFGRDGRNNFFIDCGANTVNVNVTNSIVANTPMPTQTTGTSLVRASAALALTLQNCNSFNLSDGASPTPTALTWPAAMTQTANKTVNLGWTATTTNFTLPAGSELRTSSSSGGAVGDPRWAK